MLGNEKIQEEELSSFEAGYRLRLEDGKLNISLDLYYNQSRNEMDLQSNLVFDPVTIINMDESYFYHVNQGGYDFAGGELVVKYTPVRGLSFMAYWDHRQIIRKINTGTDADTPHNLLGLGGQFKLDWGLMGSLYVYTRSEVTEYRVESPDGLLGDPMNQKLPHSMVILGKLGYGWKWQQGFSLTAGIQWFVPITPFEAPYNRIRDFGGGYRQNGSSYGALEIARMISVFLSGSI